MQGAQVSPVKPFLSDRATRRWRALLWLGFYATTAVALVSGVVGASIPGWDLPLVALAFWSCLFIGTGWILALLVVVLGQDGVLSGRGAVRWLAVPVAGLLCAVIMFSGLPIRARFEVSRLALDQAAATFESGGQVGAGRIGLYDIESVESRGPEITFFWLRGSDDYLAECALAHSRTDVSVPGGVMSRLSDTWWTWCEGSGD